MIIPMCGNGALELVLGLELVVLLLGWWCLMWRGWLIGGLLLLWLLRGGLEELGTGSGDGSGIFGQLILAGSLPIALSTGRLHVHGRRTMPAIPALSGNVNDDCLTQQVKCFRGKHLIARCTRDRCVPLVTGPS
jgi:hypothetical protein